MPTTPIEIKKTAGEPEALPHLWRSFRNEVDHLFHRFDGGFGFPAMRRLMDIEPFFAKEAFGSLMPAIDVTEDEKVYKIAAELPGLDEKDVSLTVTGNDLVIKGEKSEEKEDKERHLSERSYGSFERRFRLPDSVDRDKIAATFAKGVLTVSLPKTAKAAEPTKKINIKAA